MQIDVPTRQLLSHELIQKAVNQYGSPMYLYDFDKIAQQAPNLQSCLPDNFHIHYALKANGNLAICNRLVNSCRGSDISSLGELYTSLKAGFSPDQIIFTGPGKDDEELAAAIDAGCGLIVLESVNEASRVNQLAQQRKKVQKVLIRINPHYRTNNSCDIQSFQGKEENGKAQDLKTFICKQGGSKFGVDEDNMIEALDAIIRLENLQLKGIHIFTESNVTAYEELLAAWQNTIDIANDLSDKGYPISIVDFGGGVGIPYTPTGEPFNIHAFGKALQEISDKNHYTYEYILELGRYLVGEAGAYIVEVVNIKESHGQTFVIVNGGLQHLGRTGYLSEMNKYMEVIGRSGTLKEVKVVGKLPTSTDVIVDHVMLPENITIGDKIVIYHCGAYGFSFSLTNFIMHNYPAEVAYENEELKQIRQRGNPADFFINQLIPS